MLRVPICGDPAVGKTSLIRTIATGDFELEEFDTSSPVEVLTGKFSLIDTNCQEDSDRMRSAAYRDADAFMILFSVISPASYNSVLTKWHPEIERANAAGKPVVLVGTKCDLRGDPDALQRLEARHLAPTSFDQGAKLAHQMGAFAYIECAPNLPGGLLQLQDLLDALISGPSKKKKKNSKTKKPSSSTTTFVAKKESKGCTIV